MPCWRRCPRVPPRDGAPTSAAEAREADAEDWTDDGGEFSTDDLDFTPFCSGFCESVFRDQDGYVVPGLEPTFDDASGKLGVFWRNARVVKAINSDCQARALDDAGCCASRAPELKPNESVAAVGQTPTQSLRLNGSSRRRAAGRSSHPKPGSSDARRRAAQATSATARPLAPAVEVFDPDAGQQVSFSIKAGQGDSWFQVAGGDPSSSRLLTPMKIIPLRI